MLKKQSLATKYQTKKCTKGIFEKVYKNGKKTNLRVKKG